MSLTHKILLVLAQALFLAFFFNFSGVVSQAQESALSRPLVPVWRLATTRLTKLSPTTSAGRIYTTLDNGEIIALSEASGSRIWQTELGGDVSTHTVADANAIYVATRSFTDSRGKSTTTVGSLRCLSATGGLTRWVRDLPAPLTGSLVTNNKRLFGIDARGVLLSFDKSMGTSQWIVQHSSEFTTNIIADDARVYVGSSDGIIYALDPETGVTIWKQKILSRMSIIGYNARRIFIGTTAGWVYAYDAETGRPLWRKNLGGTIKFISSAKDGIIIASLNNSVHYVEVERGKRLWKRQLTERIATAPLVSGDAILIAPLGSGVCIVVARANGKVINTLQLESGIIATAQPILAVSTLVLTTDSGLIGYSASSASLSGSVFRIPQE